MISLERLSNRVLNIPTLGSSRVADLKNGLGIKGHSSRVHIDDKEVYLQISVLTPALWEKIPARYTDTICSILWRPFDQMPPLADNHDFLIWFVRHRVGNSLPRTKNLIRSLAWYWPENGFNVVAELKNYTAPMAQWPTPEWQQETIAYVCAGGNLAEQVAQLWDGRDSIRSQLVCKIWQDLVLATSQQLRFNNGHSVLVAIRSIIALGFDKGHFRWPKHTLYFLNTLLPPLSNQISSQASSEIKAATLRTFGRPDQGVWLDASPEAVTVGNQWLTTLRFEKFFQFINQHHKKNGDSTAERQSSARWRFWQSAIDAGVDEVQLVLGKNLRSQMSQADRMLIRPATLSTQGTGFTNDHAALVLKIGDMTMVEWSHSRASSLWIKGNPAAPPCNKSQFTADKMIAGSDEKINHRGSWQSKYADRIYQETGTWLSRERWFND